MCVWGDIHMKSERKQMQKMLSMGESRYNYMGIPVIILQLFYRFKLFSQIKCFIRKISYTY